MQDQMNVNRTCCGTCDLGGARFEPPTLRTFTDESPQGVLKVTDWEGNVYQRREFLPWDGAWYDQNERRFTWAQLIALPYGVTEQRGPA